MTSNDFNKATEEETRLSSYYLKKIESLCNSNWFKQTESIQFKPVPEGENNMSSEERKKMEERVIQNYKEREEENKIVNMHKTSTYTETKRNKVLNKS